MDIHRQIQERHLLSRDHPEEVAAGDGVVEPQACSQDCARWEGSPVGTILKYIRACVCGHSTGGGAVLCPNQNRVRWLNRDLLFSLGRAWDSLTPLVGASSVILPEQSLSR